MEKVTTEICCAMQQIFSVFREHPAAHRALPPGIAVPGPRWLDPENRTIQGCLSGAK
jgi:hypothetical protein